MEMECFTSNSEIPEFLSPTKINHNYSHISAIEMMTLQPITYTSLKDLLPPPTSSSAASSMPVLLSPLLYGSQSTSWHDIPIKNPLVKHAAWAYLQPMLTSPSPSTHRSSFFVKLKEKCECIRLLREVVLPAIKETLGRLFGERKEEEEDDDDEVAEH